MRHSRIACLLVLTVAATVPAARSAETPGALTARLVRPDAECARTLDLFRGARSPHPAAALAAWRRATGKNLNKATEALIALFNPAMIPELKTLDGTTLTLRLDPADNPLRWSATVPHDDGTFTALATALVLTDGASEAPVDAVPIDRLGPVGAPLLARTNGRVVLAGDRRELQASLARPLPAPAPAEPAGIHVRIDPSALGSAGSLSLRRFGEALRTLGCVDIRGRAYVADDALAIETTAQMKDVPNAPAIDPHWFDWVPADSTLAAVCLAIEPHAEAWERAFAAADRAERADPTRAGVAPLRVRLNLVAAAAGVRLETEVWPVLRGITACALSERGEITGAIVALHTADAAAATRLAENVLPRVAAGRIEPAPGTKPAAHGRVVGRVAGRPLAVARRDTTVAIGWGEGALKAAFDAFDHPERAAGRLARAAWGDSTPARAGIAWPARHPMLVGSALAEAEVPSVVWWGRNDGGTARDHVRWAGLRGLVRRFLDRLPLDPPPDH